MQNFFNGQARSSKYLNTFSVPSTWKKATMIIVIYKKGDIKDLNKYRSISLLYVIYKLFTKVFMNRISAMLDSNQPREQEERQRKHV